MGGADRGVTAEWSYASHYRYMHAQEALFSNFNENLWFLCMHVVPEVVCPSLLDQLPKLVHFGAFACTCCYACHVVTTIIIDTLD